MGYPLVEIINQKKYYFLRSGLIKNNGGMAFFPLINNVGILPKIL